MIKKMTIMAMLLALSSNVWADSLVYGGLSAGSSEFDHDNSLSYGIFVGSGLVPWVGGEIGYINHGKFDLPSGRIRAESAYAAIKPNLNIGALQVYAKLGVNSWVLEGDQGVIIHDDDGVDKMWAVGADYSVLGPLALGIEYVNYTVGHRDVSTINATATFYVF